MNRQIKFRGKRQDNGEWIHGDLIENQGRYFIYHATSETTIDDNDNGSISIVAYEVDTNSIGQYTGLKDKNGKEIYCGDIIELVFNNDRKSVEFVSFKNGRFVTVSPYTIYRDEALCVFVEYANVIGNVHDTPELIPEVEIIKDK